MTIKIIGSGLGRTGTKSLQTALNMLGMGPCHHMAEVFLQPETMPLWVAAADGNPEWDRIFAGYASAVDYPAAAYWRELVAYYPDAKVIHTTRDAEAWFASTQATIFAKDGPILTALSTPGHSAAAFFESFTRPLAGHLNDKNFLIDYFHRHTEEVIATIPAERLLVYEVGQAWEPLCQFLDIPVPGEPFPSENSRAAYLSSAARYRSESAT